MWSIRLQDRRAKWICLFPSSNYDVELDRDSAPILLVFLISWTKGWSKYSRPSFKPCDEAARRFLGYVMWFSFGSCTRVIDQMWKNEHALRVGKMQEILMLTVFN